MKSDCCGADVQLAPREFLCKKCGFECGNVPGNPREYDGNTGRPCFDKLTPDQLKAIRWPSEQEIIETWYETGKIDTPFNSERAVLLANWLRAYALRHLMPEEK